MTVPDREAPHPDGPDSAAIGGVAGILIWTSEDRFPAMRDFYRETLGLTPRSVRPSFVNFEWGAFRLTVSVHEGVRGANVDPLRIMLNLDVSNIQAVHARLPAAGVAFSLPPEPEPLGGVIAPFPDPAGHTPRNRLCPRLTTAATAAPLTLQRTPRTDTVPRTAGVHRQLLTQQQRLWTLRRDIAVESQPQRIREAVGEIGGEWAPIVFGRREPL